MDGSKKLLDHGIIVMEFLPGHPLDYETDVILSEDEINSFLKMYIKAVNGRFPTGTMEEQLNTYISITCLKGITWCAMAWIQYQQPDKLIFNESTYKKLQAYLSEGFLNTIEQKFS